MVSKVKDKYTFGPDINLNKTIIRDKNGKRITNKRAEKMAVDAIERVEILRELRSGEIDVLVGINLLREGLDLPEVSLVCILDADKEGFLRSDTSLIQIIGRAARNVKGKVILYADNITGSITRAINETNRRREIQSAYNKKHNITPKTILKKINDIMENLKSPHDKAVSELLLLDKGIMIKNPQKLIRQKEIQLNAAVKILDFETAAILRDEMAELKKYAIINNKKNK